MAKAAVLEMASRRFIRIPREDLLSRLINVHLGLVER